MKDVIKEFMNEVDRILIGSGTGKDHYIPDDNYVAAMGMLKQFGKWLEAKDYVIVNKCDVKVYPHVDKKGNVIFPKDEIRTIPSCEAEAIALYGYKPKRKKHGK